VRITAPFSLPFRRAQRPILASDKRLRRRLRRHSTEPVEPETTAFESTPFGLRRKRLLGPATFVKLAVVVAGLGGLAWWYLV
jgi:hypothetical protein